MSDHWRNSFPCLGTKMRRRMVPTSSPSARQAGGSQAVVVLYWSPYGDKDISVENTLYDFVFVFKCLCSLL